MFRNVASDFKQFQKSSNKLNNNKIDSLILFWSQTDLKQKNGAFYSVFLES
jgi:hypothetical protein